MEPQQDDPPTHGTAATATVADDVIVPGLRLAEELGRGARTVVYRGVADDGGQYAVKVLLSTPDDDGRAAAEFRREAALLACFDHPGLPRVHAAGASAGRPWLVMDLVAGRPLADLVVPGGMPVADAVRRIGDVAAALAVVHARGLVHRDLKPQNIMVTPSGRATLIDFGLAMQHDAALHGWSVQGAQSAAPETAHSAIGTLAYAAPEQSGVLHRPVDARSDLYAMGVVLFECLTGELPFPAQDTGDLLRMHAGMRAPDVRELVPAVPAEVARVVARLLAKDPDDRYQRAAHLAAELRALLGDDPGAPPAPATTDRIPGGAEAVPLLGRAEELAGLLRHWSAARDGQGRAVGVHGAAGAGSSRLARELVAQVADAGHAVLAARCSSDAAPLAPLRAAVESYLRSHEHRPAEERERHRRLVVEAAGAAAGALAGFSPALAEVLGNPQGVELGSAEEAATALAGLLLDLARAVGGAVLWLDDDQALDPGTRRVLRRLDAEIDTAPLLVLTSGRAGDGSGDPSVADDRSGDRVGDAPDEPTNDPTENGAGASPHAADIVLAPLPDPVVRELVGAALPGVGPEHPLAGQLAVRAGGNPFVVLQYVSAVIDAGLLTPGWDGWQLDVDGLARLDLPNDVVGLVLARVREVPDPALPHLRTAAALGAEVHADDVAVVGGGDLAEVHAALAAGTAAGLLEPAAEGRHAFVHDRVRAALLDLPARELAALHDRVADGLRELVAAGRVPESERDRLAIAVARHVLLGRPDADPAATLAACSEAGRAALRAHAPEDAVDLLEAGVRTARATGAEAPFHVLLDLGSALQRTGRFDDARRELEAALAGAGTPTDRAHVLAELAEVHRAVWDSAEAATAVGLGLTELGFAPPAHPLRLLLDSLGLVLRGLFPVRPVTDPERHERHRLAARLHSIGGYLALTAMDPAGMLVHLIRARHHALSVGRGTDYVVAQGMFGFLLGSMGMHGPSARVLDRAEVAARDLAPASEAFVEHVRGAAAYFGRLDDGTIWRAAIRRHHRWLEPWTFSDGVTALFIDAVCLGRSAEAAEWRSLAERRARVEDGARTTLFVIPPMAHAAAGRPGEAAAAEARIDHTGVERLTPGNAVMRSLISVQVLLEQDERGEPLDTAIARFEGLGLKPNLLVRPTRYTLAHQALGRVAQCRAAQDPDDTGARQRLAAARRAVDLLKKLAFTPALRGFHAVADADLQLCEGTAPTAVLARLDRVRPGVRPDSPLLAFEAARVRARAHAAAGDAGEAERQAVTALMIAQTQDWPHRARWIGDEFGVVGGPVSRSGSGGGRATTAGRGSSAGPLRTTNRATGSRGPGGATTSRAAVSTSASGRGSMDRSRLRAVEQVSAAAARVLDPAEVARVALDELVRMFAAERAALFVVDAGAARLFRARDDAGSDLTELTGYSASLVSRVLTTGRPLVVTGTEQGAALGAQSAVIHGLRSILVAPLQSENRVLGVVYLDSRVAKGIFSSDDLGTLTAVTGVLAAPLETARAAELEISVRTAQHERDLAERLRATMAAMTSTLDPEEVLDLLVGAARELVPCADARLVRDTGEAADVATADAVVLALSSAEGPVGRLELTGERDGRGPSDAVDLAATLVAQGMAAYSTARLFAKVQQLAVADELTGVPNRRRFFEIAERDVAAAQRFSRPLAVLMVDIDHFKAVNDTYGHQVGDDVIREVAARLQSGLRRTDVVGRYGGEEFAVLLPEAEPDTLVAERLRRAVCDTPIPTRGGDLQVTVSIGMAVLSRGDAGLTSALGRADQALYEAKRGGRNRVEVAAAP